MKTMKYLSMMLVILAMSVCVVSCGDDDDEGSTMDIVGTWISESGVILVFKSDGTGTKSNENGSVNFEYTYSAEGRKLVMMLKGETTYITYEVQRTGNTLTLDMEGLVYKYTKK